MTNRTEAERKAAQRRNVLEAVERYHARKRGETLPLGATEADIAKWWKARGR